MKEAEFDLLGLEATEKILFQETFDKLNASFDLHIESNYKFNFKNFSIFNEYEDYYTRDAFKIVQANSYSHVTFTEVSYSFAGGRSGEISGREIQVWGIVNLNFDYGKILVQPETLFLKIQELINPIEIDFEEDKKFSKRYYLLASDKEKARRFFKPEVRKIFLELSGNDYFIEINNNVLIIGNKKRVHPLHGLEIANFVSHLTSINL